MVIHQNPLANINRCLCVIVSHPDSRVDAFVERPGVEQAEVVVAG